VKKGWRVIILSAVLALVLLFPQMYGVTDGGTVIYRAILYRVTFRHSIDEREPSGYRTGTEVWI
jgi:hypothetical protein